MKVEIREEIKTTSDTSITEVEFCCNSWKKWFGGGLRIVRNQDKSIGVCPSNISIVTPSGGKNLTEPFRCCPFCEQRLTANITSVDVSSKD